jgi:hypothetical protein
MFRYAVSSLLVTANLFREKNEKLPDLGFHHSTLDDERTTIHQNVEKHQPRNTVISRT